MVETNGMDKAKPNQAKALHAAGGDSHTVMLDNVKVLIWHDGEAWFAHGLEIDYFAQGATFKEMKIHFEEGLSRTIVEHVKDYKTIEGVLKPAPTMYWDKFHQESFKGNLGGTLKGRVRFKSAKPANGTPNVTDVTIVEYIYPISYLCSEKLMAQAVDSCTSVPAGAGAK